MRKKLIIILTILFTIAFSYSTAYALEAPKEFRGSQNGPVEANTINFAWDSDLFNREIKGYVIIENGFEILDVGKKNTAVLKNVSVGTHKYKLKSYDENGIGSKLSNQVTFKVLEPPRIVRCSSADRAIKFEWEKPEVNNIKHFVVLRNGTFYKTVDRIRSSFEDTGVTVDNLYEYSLVIVDTDGNYSMQSNKVTGKVTKYQKVRGKLEASLEKTSIKLIKVNWDGKGQKYYVYRKIDSGSWSCVQETYDVSFYDDDVEIGHTYRYQVKAFDSNKNTVYETNEKSVSVSAKKSLTTKFTETIGKVGLKLPMFQLTGSITGPSNSFGFAKGNLNIKPIQIEDIKGSLSKFSSISAIKQKVNNIKGEAVKLGNTQIKRLTKTNFTKKCIGQTIEGFKNRQLDKLGKFELKMSNLRSKGNSLMAKIGDFTTDMLSRI